MSIINSAKDNKTIINPTANIDLTAIQENWISYKKSCENKTIVSAVLKSNAYSMGSKEVFKVLVKSGCKHFWVATLNEAIELHQINSDVEIAVFEGINSENIAYYINNSIVGAINHSSQIPLWLENNNLRIWIHIDTGMNRLGIHHSTAIDKLKNIPVPLGYMSHLCSSEETNNSLNDKQLNLFNNIVANLPSNTDTKYSISNSDGVFLGKDYHKDMVPVGIGLYGIIRGNDRLKPVIKLSAPILNITNISSGESISYNSTFTANKDMTVACVGIGYADGLSVNIPNKGNFKSSTGKNLPIIGKVSMDTSVIDITGINDIIIGDSIVVFDTIADIINMSMSSSLPLHNILTNLPGRTVKLYKGIL